MLRSLLLKRDCRRTSSPYCLLAKGYTSISSMFDRSSHTRGLFRSAEPILAGASGKVYVIGADPGQVKICTTSRAIFDPSLHPKPRAQLFLVPDARPLGISFPTVGIASSLSHFLARREEKRRIVGAYKAALDQMSQVFRVLLVAFKRTLKLCTRLSTQ